METASAITAPHRPSPRRRPGRRGARPPLVVLALLLGLAISADAQEVPVKPPEDPTTREVPSEDEPPPGAEPARPDGDAQVVVVTATRHETTSLDTPFSVSSLGREEILAGPNSRSLPDALTREPGVLLQKTGPGQSSPYLRGFTGFRTLWLVDGIRLNNSVWRDGPNQYSGTIDLFAVDRLEVVRGPGSTLWGSDAIGGTIQARSEAARTDAGWSGLYEARYADAEDSFVQRFGIEGGRPGVYGLKGGVTVKDFGDIESGDGRLPGTGYDELDADLRLDMPLSSRVDLTVGIQTVDQDDVPRTHKTLDSVPYHGTLRGTERFRDLDQDRDLFYVRGSWTPGGRTFYDEASLTASYQTQEEKQERGRSGGRYDEQGFDVHTTGVQLELVSDTDFGTLTYGADIYHDEVDSYRRNFTNGVSDGPTIQGPVGDDARYDLLGVYVQDEVEHGDMLTLLGLRFTYAAADADEVDDPNVPGSDPSTPGNVIDVDESWTDLSASWRTLAHVSDTASVYAGLSQGFRAPNLSDLTSNLEDSGAESPTPDLDPERFLTAEVGAKRDGPGWRGEATVFRTWVDDMIVRSPTGASLPDGTPVVRKDNASDGHLWGIELRGERELGPDVTLYASASWIDGSVEQLAPSGKVRSGPPDRLMPLTGVAGGTWAPEGESWWVQADVFAADDADELSFRDETDLERIPPGGTPGFAVVGVRGGVRLDGRSTVHLGVENIFDRNYRIHGSGQNEPGRNLVVSWSVHL